MNNKIIDITRDLFKKELGEALSMDLEFQEVLKLDMDGFKVYVYTNMLAAKVQLAALRKTVCEIIIRLADLHGTPYNLEERQKMEEALNIDRKKILKIIQDGNMPDTILLKF